LVACRTPCDPWDMRFPLCVRRMGDGTMFSSVCALPCPGSGGGCCPSLFGWFTATTAQSDFSWTFMSAVRFMAFAVDALLTRAVRPRHSGINLFAVLSFELLSLFHLRRVSTLTEAGRRIEPIPGLPLVAIGSMLVIFFSGIYLVADDPASGRRVLRLVNAMPTLRSFAFFERSRKYSPKKRCRVCRSRHPSFD
jgi:hypothetical protein